uniref:Fibronectin type-III domain-containing protein n=1 Tax=Strongyloides papillosus TaxID=174720 RepID=A0A0N5B2X5_STREA
MSTLVNIKYAPIPIPPAESEIILSINKSVTIDCEFEGTPTPQIKWYHNDTVMAITNLINYNKTKTGLKSTLFIDGDNSNYDIFGEYYCLGSNSVKESVPSQRITIYLKEKPETPTISCFDELSATKAICNVDSGIEPGRRPETITIFYVVDDLEDDIEEETWRDGKEYQTIKYDETIIIANLQPDTNFVGRALSINEAGVSELGPKFYFKTDPPGLPEPIKSIDVDCTKICTFTWEHAEVNGGSDLKYKLTFNATQNDALDLHYATIETPDNHLTFEHLKPETEYIINVITTTKEGESEIFTKIIQTPDTLLPQSFINWPFGSFSKFLAISSISMILIITTIDFILYITYRCGFIFFILTHCCGKKLNKTSQNNEDIENNGPESSKLLSENQPINV